MGAVASRMGTRKAHVCKIMLIMCIVYIVIIIKCDKIPALNISCKTSVSDNAIYFPNVLLTLSQLEIKVEVKVSMSNIYGQKCLSNV